MCLSEHGTPPGSLFSNMRPSHDLEQCDFLFFIKQLDLETFMDHFKSSVATYMHSINTLLFRDFMLFLCNVNALSLV